MVSPSPGSARVQKLVALGLRLRGDDRRAPTPRSNEQGRGARRAGPPLRHQFDPQVVVALTAVDAQGRKVASSYEVDGDVLVIKTPHRDQGLAYPVLVDPEFTVKDDWAWAGGRATAPTLGRSYRCQGDGERVLRSSRRVV